jgi:hypothetical protein
MSRNPATKACPAANHRGLNSKFLSLYPCEGGPLTRPAPPYPRGGNAQSRATTQTIPENVNRGKLPQNSPHILTHIVSRYQKHSKQRRGRERGGRNSRASSIRGVRPRYPRSFWARSGTYRPKPTFRRARRHSPHHAHSARPAGRLAGEIDPELAPSISQPEIDTFSKFAKLTIFAKVICL